MNVEQRVAAAARALHDREHAGEWLGGIYGSDIRSGCPYPECEFVLRVFVEAGIDARAAEAIGRALEESG